MLFIAYILILSIMLLSHVLQIYTYIIVFALLLMHQQKQSKHLLQLQSNYSHCNALFLAMLRIYQTFSICIIYIYSCILYIYSQIDLKTLFKVFSFNEVQQIMLIERFIDLSYMKLVYCIFQDIQQFMYIHAFYIYKLLQYCSYFSSYYIINCFS